MLGLFNRRAAAQQPNFVIYWLLVAHIRKDKIL